MNKKGFQLAISTLIVIILGLLILIALSLAFTTGFEGFMNRLRGFQGSEIDNAVNECKTACTMKNEHDFCCKERIVEDEKVTCKDLVEQGKIECDIDCANMC